MGYVVLIISAAAGALFGQTYKRKAEYGLDTAMVLAWFALVSVALLGTIVLVVGFTEMNRAAIWMPFAHGVAMAIAMHSYYAVIGESRLGISWTVIQLSVVIPFFVSVVVYEEPLGRWAALGLASVLLAIVLFGMGKERSADAGTKRDAGSRGALLLLLSASVFTGVTSALLRSFASYHPEPQAVPTFFLLVSSTLLLINLPICVYRSARGGYRPWNRLTAIFSLYKSVTNMTAMGLLLVSVQLLPGFFVFPVRNTLNILFVLGLSAALHRERVTKLEAFGLLWGILGIGLLSYAMQ